MSMTTAQYLALVEQIGYTPAQAAVLREQIEAGSASARFTVYGTALRKGLVKREGQGARYAAWLKATGQSA